MSRAHFYKPIQNGTGDLLSNSSIQVLEPGTSTLISDLIYEDIEGPTTMSNPFTAEAGVISFYLDASRYVDIKVVTSFGTERTFEDMLVPAVDQDAGTLEEAFTDAITVFEDALN